MHRGEALKCFIGDVEMGAGAIAAHTHEYHACPPVAGPVIGEGADVAGDPVGMDQ